MCHQRISRRYNKHLDVRRRVARGIADDTVIFIDAHFAIVQLFPENDCLRHLKWPEEPALHTLRALAASQQRASGRTIHALRIRRPNRKTQSRRET